MIVHPFADTTCYTQVHNAVFDTLMPELPANAFKVLCFILRKTIGWGRAEWGLSYTQLSAGTGIRGSETLSVALRTLRERGAILVTLGATFDAARYRLNPAFELEWEPDFPTSEIEAPTSKIEAEAADLPTSIIEPTTKIEVVSTSKIEVVSTSKIEEIMKKENQLEKRESWTGDAPSAPGAPAPDLPPPSASRGRTGPTRNTRPTSTADPNQQHPAVGVLVEERGDRRRPNAAQAALIVDTIGTDQDSLTRWRTIVKRQLVAGKGERVDWMVEAWQEETQARTKLLALASPPTPVPPAPPKPVMTPEQRREFFKNLPKPSEIAAQRERELREARNAS